MIKTLINPMLLQKPESNFLGEIYNGKETKRITKQYLNSFSKERRQIRRAGYHLDIMTILFTVSLRTISLLIQNKTYYDKNYQPIKHYLRNKNI